MVDVDEEMFEDNAEEYIRRDIEGSDIDTRRRAACDLVRALCKSFEGPVIQNFSAYIQAMLQVTMPSKTLSWYLILKCLRPPFLYFCIF